MKTKNQIMARFKEYFELKLRFENEYYDLNQIDMLSAEGSNLLKKINELNGAMDALKWVLI